MSLDDLIKYYVDNGIPFTADLVDRDYGKFLRPVAYSKAEDVHPYVVID